MKFSKSIIQWIPAAILMTTGCLMIVGCGGEGAPPQMASDVESASEPEESSGLRNDDQLVSEYFSEAARTSSALEGAEENGGAMGGGANNKPGSSASEPMDAAAMSGGTELESAIDERLVQQEVASGRKPIPTPSVRRRMEQDADRFVADESKAVGQTTSPATSEPQQRGGQQGNAAPNPTAPAEVARESHKGGEARKSGLKKMADKTTPAFGSRQLTFPGKPKSENEMLPESESPTLSKRGGVKKASPADKSKELAELQDSREKPAAPADQLMFGVSPRIVTPDEDAEEERVFSFYVPIRDRMSRSKSKQVNKTLQLDFQPGEELWIIAKATDAQTAVPSEDVPRCGALMATLPKQTTQVPVPLKHTSVTGNIDGYIATVNVNQQFQNPYDSKIEAVYVFPLPQNAAVNEFVMTVGDRKIRGIIREREKAEQIYAAAKRQGHVASLMTQERANIFTQKVANIEPGKQIDIDIRYFNTLQYDDGAYEFVFPMVVGPRFNPPASGDGVGAVARGTNGSSGQKTEVSYLAPTERSGHDISLSLNISAGVDIEDVHCVNHKVDVKNLSETERTVQLSGNDSIPNKDFVLRYKVAGDQIKTAMLTHEDKRGKYFTMMLYPPADLEQVSRSPMEMVFVLDCSGSMKGQPLAQAKAAISHALQSLTPRDTFQIIRFSNNASQLGAEPVLATDENIKRGLKYLTSLNSTGGTHMIEGIKAALDFPHDEGRFRLVSFMTDGYIGNEQQILGTMYDKLGASRVFSFGVGSSPNRMLMNRMAILGRGAVAYLSLNDDATEIMDGFNRRISHPAMTDLTIDWGNMRVADVYPQRIPDLIVGRPVVITGRFKGEPGTVSVNGRVDMEPKLFQVSLDKDGAEDEHSGIAAVWARLKIKDMMNVATHAPEAAAEIKQAVTQTALAYNLMSSYTSFVAVDSLTKTDGDYGTTVAVPVPVPEGVKYETTVGPGHPGR